MVLENVQEISENETDVAIRFINFIDNAYFNKIKLFMSSEVEMEDIYKSGSRLFEFKRTISRIKEMNAM
jgi:cell division protein ZapE